MIKKEKKIKGNIHEYVISGPFENDMEFIQQKCPCYTTSDIRLESIFSKILQFRPVTFQYKNERQEDISYAEFIAQEVE